MTYLNFEIDEYVKSLNSLEPKHMMYLNDKYEAMKVNKANLNQNI